MRITKKLELITKIADTINDKYDETEKEIFFEAFKAELVWEQDYQHEYFLHTKKTLSKLKEITIKEIAEELDISVSEHIIQKPPKNWENSDNIKAFISHISKEKNLAKRLRDELKHYDIDSFVAHEDIKPSEEWQIEINKALQTMDFFISMHTEGFADSYWCQQEVGFAVARGIKIIPIKFDNKHDPVGFIAKIQALLRGDKTAQIVAKEIIEILKNDEKTKHFYNEIKDVEDFEEEEIPF